MKMENLDTGVLILHRLILKLYTKVTKTKQCSKQTCLQTVILPNITTNTSLKKW